MIRLVAVLHLWGLDVHRTAASLHQGPRRPPTGGRSSRSSGERGSVTIENVLWAVAVIAIVAIVVVAIKGYVRTQAGKIQ